jgi:hypothetical protein
MLLFSFQLIHCLQHSIKEENLGNGYYKVNSHNFNRDIRQRL